MSMKVLAFHDVSSGILGHERGPWEKKKTRKEEKENATVHGAKKSPLSCAAKKG
jgi:hypothetical protein